MLDAGRILILAGLAVLLAIIVAGLVETIRDGIARYGDDGRRWTWRDVLDDLWNGKE